jgi:hypothetical protein
MKTLTLPLLAALMLLVTTANAQDAAKKDSVAHWNNTMTAGLNLTQVSLTNWTKGGENSLAWTLIVGGKFLYTSESYTWTNTIKASYGQTKLGGRDFEKTEDELFGESIYAYNVGWPVNPYAGLTVKTQFQPGYAVTNGVRTKTSDFWDPGYLMQSAGFTYAPNENFSTRLGVALKETFSSKYGFAGKNDDGTLKTSNLRTGIESGTSAKYSLMQNILYTSQLNLFSAFDKLDVWDVRWDNTITAKVNSYIQTTLNVLVVHEVAQSRRTQVKESIAVGLTYTLF